MIALSWLLFLAVTPVFGIDQNMIEASLKDQLYSSLKDVPIFKERDLGIHCQINTKSFGNHVS